MAILDVQAVVRRPQEGLELKNSIEPRSQNLAEKKNSFSQHLKKMSRRELEPGSSPPVRKELPPKNTSFERSIFEQKADSIVDSVDANGELKKQTPVQEKPDIQAKPDSEDRKNTEANQSVLASVETASTQGIDKQSQDEDNELDAASIGLVQPQCDLTVTPDSEASQTTSAVEIVMLPAQGAGKQVEGQNQEPLAATLETAQSQEAIQPVAALLEVIEPLAAEKTVQASIELISSVSESAPSLSQAEAIETVLASNTQGNVQQDQGKENTYAAKMNVITSLIEETQVESTASSSSTNITAEINPQAETLSVPENQAAETENNAAAKPTSSVPGNPLVVTDNAILAEDPEQMAKNISDAPTLPGDTTAAALEAEQAKKAGKSNDKDRMKLQLLEKPLGDQLNQKVEEPAAKDVKKIMELENHRLANSKIPADAPLLEEAVQETGVEEGKTLAFLDKTLVELAKPGGEVVKAQPSNSAQPAVSPEELMEQIVKKVELVSKQANSEMRIQLKPEFLGKMMIQIIVDDGVITARFTTESQHVKQVLEANMNTLKQNLEANGLRVEKTEVNVQLDNGGNFNNNSEGNRQQLWQQMTAQGRNSNHYDPYNRGTAGEIQDLVSYQQEVSATQIMNEGRLDFTI